jgi:hypothetical protein
MKDRPLGERRLPVAKILLGAGEQNHNLPERIARDLLRRPFGRR